MDRACSMCQTQVHGAEGGHADCGADLQRGGADAADIRGIAGRHGAREMGDQSVEPATQPEPADAEQRREQGFVEMADEQVRAYEQVSCGHQQVARTGHQRAEPGGQAPCDLAGETKRGHPR
jgi:hypothetical protein